MSFGAAASQSATVTGIGERTVKGSGVLQAQPATVFGTSATRLFNATTEQGALRDVQRRSGVLVDISTREAALSSRDKSATLAPRFRRG